MKNNPLLQFANGMIITVLGSAWVFGKLGNIETGIALHPLWVGWLTLVFGIFQMLSFFKIALLRKKNA